MQQASSSGRSIAQRSPHNRWHRAVTRPAAQRVRGLPSGAAAALTRPPPPDARRCTLLRSRDALC
jgi:hypothetical protein